MTDTVQRSSYPLYMVREITYSQNNVMRYTQPILLGLLLLPDFGGI